MPRLKFSGLIIILSLQLIKCDLNEGELNFSSVENFLDITN